MSTQRCTECGQPTQCRPWRIAPNQIKCLVELYTRFGISPVQVKEISHDIYLIANFPKLRFWGLIEKYEKTEYRITAKGIAFLKGEVPVIETIWIFNNQKQSDPIGFKNKYVRITDIHPSAFNITSHLRRSVPVNDDRQQVMAL